jgi:hypothetical protein
MRNGDKKSEENCNGLHDMPNVKVPGGVNIFKKAHPRSVFSMERG